MTFEKVKMYFDIFLIEHSAYEAFYENVDDDWEDCVTRSGFIAMVNNGFIWDYTPQGPDYWSDLEDKWFEVWEKLSE